MEGYSEYIDWLDLEDGYLDVGKSDRVIYLSFFFQAEDGIRDFCLSRGLGDVYKGQDCNR